MQNVLALLLAAMPVAGMGAAQTIDQRANRVDALFDSWVAPGSPGAALAVIENGKIIYEKGYGLATLEHEVPITPQSVFYIGSTSKQFVAAAVLLLEQDGKLSLDDDLRRWVPEIPDYGTLITLRHLIHHTSGIRDYLGLMDLAGLELGHFHSDEGVIELLARQKALNFQPGDQYLYSNSGYFLLGVVVRRASGKSLREFAQERIFQPLGMHETHFHDRYTHVIKNRAFAYFPAGGGRYEQFFTSFDRVGSGGVFSTVEDLARWDQNFYDKTVGGEALIERLHARGRLNSGAEIDYASGLILGDHRGLKTVSHGGALGGYRAELLRFPDQRFSVIVLANLSAFPGQLPMQVAEIFLGQQMTAASEGAGRAASHDSLVSVAAEDLERVSGSYWNAMEGYARRLYVKDGTLTYQRSIGDETVLGALGNDRFLMLGIPNEVEVRFVPVGAVKPRQMTVVVDGGEPSIFEAFESVTLLPAELEAYVGRYYSSELDTEYAVELQGGALTIGSPRTRRFPLAPLVAETFGNAFAIGPVTAVRFFRDRDGAVTGFAVDAGRVRNLGFEKR